MKQAKQSWHIWFWVMLLTAITGAASIPGIVLFAIYKQFFLMALCIVLTMHAFFGITFYAIAMANAAHDVRLLRTISNYELTTIADLASATGMSYSTTKESLERCIKRGYLEGYSFDGDTLQHIAPVERHCIYCGRVLLANEAECPGCGAHGN